MSATPDFLTIILSDRSYCVHGRYAALIRAAYRRGDRTIDVEVPCQHHPETVVSSITVVMAAIVSIIHHSAMPTWEETDAEVAERKVIAFPRRDA